MDKSSGFFAEIKRHFKVTDPKHHKGGKKADYKLETDETPNSKHANVSQCMDGPTFNSSGNRR